MLNRLSSKFNTSEELNEEEMERRIAAIEAKDLEHQRRLIGAVIFQFILTALLPFLLSSLSFCQKWYYKTIFRMILIPVSSNRGGAAKTETKAPRGC